MIQNSSDLVLGFKSAVADLKEELTCPVCFNPFADPVLIDGCSHIFCKACLTQSTKHSGRNCPLCRASFDKIAAMRFLPSLNDKVTTTLQHLAPMTAYLEELTKKLEARDEEVDTLLARKDHYKRMMLTLQDRVTRVSSEMQKALDAGSKERPDRDSTLERERRLQDLKERMEELRGRSTRARAEQKHKTRMAASYSVLLEGSVERRRTKVLRRGILGAPVSKVKMGRSVLHTDRSRREFPVF